jgi:2-keto-4-pentenoate hydratase/2-oxohepta-3-ene-1,7-dioic acid hydratase in catechol pathway
MVARDGHDFVIDLNRAGLDAPNMRALLTEAQCDFSRVDALAHNATSDCYIDIRQVKLGPVIPDPNKIICIGLNYRDHAEETKLALPDTPTVFAKYSNTLIGSGQAINLPETSDRVDYEAELAFVIGKRARHVSTAQALQYVAGYTVFNDVSARDYQLRITQWTLGKSFDTFAPVGPALVTSDEVSDPHKLFIRLWIGDALLQNSNTSNLIFRVPQLVSYLSTVMTLEPGDIVATGTPAGVGFTRRPPRYLQHGEVVRIEIEGLGVLENPVA